MNKEKRIHAMFSSIAHRYDFLNTLLSFNRDKYWRRFAVEKAELKEGQSAIDVATGTGELALELAKVAGATGRVVGVDFCEEMLEKAKDKIRSTDYREAIELIAENARNLPFKDNTFDCATIGFALRNVESVRETLREMRRVVKPGGRVVSLEFTQPESRLFGKLYSFYSFRILPFVGGVFSGRRDAYAYIPSSVLSFPSKEKLKAMMDEVGLKDVKVYTLTGGIVAVHVGVKA